MTVYGNARVYDNALVHEAEYRAFIELALARQQEWIAKECSS